MKTIAEKITNILGHKIEMHIETMGSRIYICVAPENLLESMSFVKNELDCEFSASSGFAENDSFIVVYMLFNHKDGYMVNIRTTKQTKNPVFPSIKDIYPEANWAEKELANRYNIQFEDNQKNATRNNESEDIVDVYASVLDLDIESII